MAPRSHNRHLRPAAWACFLLALALTTCAAGGLRPAGEPAGYGIALQPSWDGSIVAVGDLHGDVDAARAALRLAGLIDEADHWCGGATLLVQTGDRLDRGDTERELLDLFEDLAREAAAQGGRVVALVGNHEVFNVQLESDCVTERGWRAFDDCVDQGFDPAAVARFPPEQRGRAAAFLPGGPYARMLAAGPVMLQVGRTVFVHGGITSAHLDYGPERLNAEVAAWLRGESAEAPAAILGRDAPTWERAYSLPHPTEASCRELATVLRRLQAERMVMSHTVQAHGINSACAGRAWRIDTGMSRFFGGPIQALRIDGDTVRILGEGRPTVPLDLQPGPWENGRDSQRREAPRGHERPRAQ